MHKTYPATLTTGEEYVGNQQYKGSGIQKYCALCGCHRNQLGGSIRFVMGGRHWVCQRHPKVKPNA